MVILNNLLSLPGPNYRYLLGDRFKEPLSDQAKTEIVDEAVRVLKPGGHLIISVQETVEQAHAGYSQLLRLVAQGILRLNFADEVARGVFEKLADPQSPLPIGEHTKLYSPFDRLPEPPEPEPVLKVQKFWRDLVTDEVMRGPLW